MSSLDIIETGIPPSPIHADHRDERDDESSAVVLVVVNGFGSLCKLKHLMGVYSTG